MNAIEGKRARRGRRTRRTLELLQEFSIPLISGVVLAIVWANLDHQGYEALLRWSPFEPPSPLHTLNLHFFANEILMVFFFGVAAKEITEACLPGGALNPVSKAINPLLGTLGGVLGPIGVFFAMTWLLGAPHIRGGWGVPTATDIALAWLVARMAFGAKHPAVSYLLLLAVADDAIGLAIIAVFYPDPVNPVVPVWLLLVAAAMALAYLLARLRAQSFWPYVLVAGGLSWFGLHAAHLHPALALVPVVPFMPNRGRDIGLYAEEASGRIFKDTLNRFEHFFKKPVDFGLFAFGLANAGVQFSAAGAATWSVLVALVVGKTCGVSLFALSADKLGFRLPDGMDAKSVVVAGMVAGLGLTVALFVAGVAFTDPVLQGAAKMGALLSSLAAPFALIAARVARVKRMVLIDNGELRGEGDPQAAQPSTPAEAIDELSAEGRP